MFEELITDIEMYLKGIEGEYIKETEVIGKIEETDSILVGMENWFLSKIKKKSIPLNDIEDSLTIEDLPEASMLEASMPEVSIPEASIPEASMPEVPIKYDAASRWLQEKKDLITAKYNEDKKLKEEHEMRYKEFKRTIGLTLGI